MEQITLRFTASGQKLTSADCPYHLASNTVNYVRAAFDLDDTWQAFDAVRAEWSTNRHTISTVLDFNGECAVPHEVLEKLKKVSVNLVGSVTDEDALTDRLTTYPLEAVNVDAEAFVDGDNTAEVTPSEFDQYVQAVEDAVADIRDVDTVTLNDDYTLTFTFSSGDPVTVGPIRGAQGERGPEGPEGPQGEPGEVTLAQLEQVLPTDTASGAIASFPDGSDLFDYLSCIVNIEPVQAGSGTPSPDNVRPITGWTGCEVSNAGVNLIDEANTTIYMRYFQDLGDKHVWTSDAGSGSFAFICKPNTTYTVSCDNSIIALFRVGYIDVDPDALASSESPALYGVVKKTASGSTTITTGADAKAVIVQVNNAIATARTAKLQIELGSTATTYTPYNGTTYPVSWQTEAGTVYGGTVDVVTGVLTVDRAGVDLGAIDYSMFSSGFSRSRFRTTALETLIKKPPNNNTPVEAISSIFDLVNWGTGNSTNVVGVFGVDTDGDLSVWLNDSDYSDATAFKTAMSGQKVVYKLAQAQTYQLDPVQVACLRGQNNVWADCGDTSVTYKADVQRWVEKKLAE